MTVLSALSSSMVPTSIGTGVAGPMDDGSAVRASKAPEKQGADSNAAGSDPIVVQLGGGRSGIGDPSARTDQSVVFAELLFGKQSACASSSEASNE